MDEDDIARIEEAIEHAAVTIAAAILQMGTTIQREMTVQSKGQFTGPALRDHEAVEAAQSLWDGGE